MVYTRLPFNMIFTNILKLQKDHENENLFLFIIKLALIPKEFVMQYLIHLLHFSCC